MILKPSERADYIRRCNPERLQQRLEKLGEFYKLPERAVAYFLRHYPDALNRWDRGDLVGIAKEAMVDIVSRASYTADKRPVYLIVAMRNKLINEDTKERTYRDRIRAE